MVEDKPMNEKIKNYVELLFEGVPRSQKAIELRNEILSNLNDKFEALRAEGKTENEAYGLAVADLGNVDELIKELMPNFEISENINKEKKRKSILTALGVALYIFAAACLILLSEFDIKGSYSVVIFLIIAGIATAILIYSDMSTPFELVPYFKKGNCNSYERPDDKQSYLLSSLRNFYWIVIVLIYFVVSFSMNCWHISWLIFLGASACWQGIQLLVLYSDRKKGNDK